MCVLMGYPCGVAERWEIADLLICPGKVRQDDSVCMAPLCMKDYKVASSHPLLFSSVPKNRTLGSLSPKDAATSSLACRDLPLPTPPRSAWPPAWCRSYASGSCLGGPRKNNRKPLFWEQCEPRSISDLNLQNTQKRKNCLG